MTISFKASESAIQRGRASKPIPPYVQAAVDQALKEPNGTVVATGSADEIKPATLAFRRYRELHKDEYRIVVSPRDNYTRLVVEVTRLDVKAKASK